MDLLMHLIEKNKIDLYDIPVALLTQQYLDYLDAMKRFNIDIASTFLVMAATLLSIKSRMMLPKSSTEEDGGEEEDPRKELIERLLAYRKYQQASQALTRMAEQEGRCCARPPMEIPTTHALSGGLSLSKLLSAYGMAVRVGEELRVPKALVTPDPIRVQDKLDWLEERLQQGNLRFSETFSPEDAGELIASFLAILELLRLGEIAVKQTGIYRDFWIQKKTERPKKHEIEREGENL